MIAFCYLILFVLIGFISGNAQEKKEWWHNAVSYEIYIRSFKDSLGTGVGNLKGIEDRLDYLKGLGVDILWITPFYPSSNVDMGYDISDYKNVDGQFGTLDDFDSLVKNAHARGMKVVVDMVFSHTSNEHPWFIEAKKSKESVYHDYYLWQPPREDGSMPNDWKSWFSGPAWEYNEATKEFYLHIFAKEQPALNWNNSLVREEIFSVAKFWLDRKVDGIRFDVISLIALPEIDQSCKLWGNMPLARAYLKMLDDQILSQYNIFTVGETPGVALENVHEYVEEGTGSLKTIFQLEIMSLGNEGDKFHPAAHKLTDFKEIYRKWYETLYGKGWISVVLGNHDEARAISRWGDDTNYWKESGKMLATFLLTQWGIPYIFQGDEIGMTNCPFDPSEFNDVEEINYYAEKVAEGKCEEEFLPGLLARCRDNSRTPMQWDDAKNASFSTAESTWLKVNPIYETINVEAERKDPDSILNYYKKMIALRKSIPAFIYGTVNFVDFENEQVFAYTREYEGSKFLVVCNFSAESLRFDTFEEGLKNCEVLICNYAAGPQVEGSKIDLHPFESIVLKMIGADNWMYE